MQAGKTEGRDLLPPVSKTAVLTLRARAEEHLRVDRVFDDPLAAEWIARVPWPSELDAWYGPSAQLALALRADDIDHIVRRYARAMPPLAVTELGCGLSTRRHRLADLPLASWLDVDLEGIVDLRRALGVESGVAASVLDEAWMDRLPRDLGPGAQLFIAEGLLYYLPRRDVDRLLATLAQRFPGSAIIMDVLGVNDHSTLLQHTTSVGAPVEWKLESDFEAVLDDFGLDLVSGFEPDRLFRDALERYWSRFDNKQRGLIWWTMTSDHLRRGRSGTILGRLNPAQPGPIRAHPA